ncbi:hypothetical protein [Halobaculum limi]|uniref:hypothetical protein n=1 Tax=Halobaculum limi TaxID=3031916 RepID=UPI0024063B23|nr:hypothetical protein [Halobaculum sp. YSMS11]
MTRAPAFPTRRWVAVSSLAVLVIAGGCLAADARGGKVVGTYRTTAPAGVDAVDRDAIGVVAIDRAVDDACRAKRPDDTAVVEFTPNEQTAVRDAYERLIGGGGDLYVRCGDADATGDSVVQVDLRLYS